MEIFRGGAALSDSAAGRLLKEVQQIDPKATKISAEFLHFVDCKAPLTDSERTTLQTLLTYGTPYSGESTAEVYLTVPRPGTISPWSSKATDIAHTAGLTNVLKIERGIAYYIDSTMRTEIAPLLHDRMTEAVLESAEAAKILFEEHPAKPLVTIDILKGGKDALAAANAAQGLALSEDEVEYLSHAYTELNRNPSDAELMMFGQVNSEHCRHKIFNADWVIDGQKQPKSLFKMIRNTYEKGGQDVLSAYSDNAAVLRGSEGGRFFADPRTHQYAFHREPIHTVIKVETHNHPTAIAPFPGAATGTGGEIRDEGATGKGAKPKMGLAGFSVSNLRIPDYIQPWEAPYGKPDRISTPLSIIIDAPLGGAGFANEFGRPNLSGFFRTYEQHDGEHVRGYHKPIMIAGGLGNIRDQHVAKGQLKPGDKIIILGGPAMLIGLGGGAASSMQTGASHADLDFASVQRGNAEMERRCQEVIDACWAGGDTNPITMIHDIGAGGYCNAVPELVHDAGLGAEIELRDIHNAEPSMSPMEIWCNEAQERYVLGISPDNLAVFEAFCVRERCPYTVIGTATEDPTLVVHDRLLGNDTVNLPMSVLFGRPPKMTREFSRISTPAAGSTKSSDAQDWLQNTPIDEAVSRVLHMPSVGSKKFLITIGDRSVTGLVTRDQMVGPWQVPVSDVAVTAAAFDSDHGEAMAMGERAPLAITDAPASGRMAIAETITNLLAADIQQLQDIKLSANWMAAAGQGHEDQALYDTVYAVGEEFCPSLGLTIPVGKDSLSMRTTWNDGDEAKSVTSPLSLIITGFSPVSDVTKTLTPELDRSVDSVLLYVDLSGGNARLGGSALAQAYGAQLATVPDADPVLLKGFFEAITALKHQNILLAYHDRSDGGLLTTLCEMAFASRSGLDISLDDVPGTPLEVLFSEELGVVLQVKATDEKMASQVISDAIGSHVYRIGRPVPTETLSFRKDNKLVYENTRAQLETWWAETSYQIQKLRDNPACADQEFASITEHDRTKLTPLLPAKNTIPSSQIASSSPKPRVAVFREQGVNGQVEMAAAFTLAGFSAVDVHLNDLLVGAVDLADFQGLVACGGFSYGDVLGAGGGWAKTILLDSALRAAFTAFFERPDTFTLGVCNGCQMLSELKELIPGASDWPKFLQNKSERFEARLVQMRITASPSIFLAGLEGSVLPVPVAHGEGLAVFDTVATQNAVATAGLVAGQYVDASHKPTETYPENPNGSPDGITALTTPDGRATIMMPHPERAFQTRQLSWHPQDWEGDSPWMSMFHNARAWAETARTKQ